MFVGWLLNAPATGECISGTDLLRQFYVLPHWDRSCRSNFPSHPVTVYWYWADQSQRWPYNARRLAGELLESQFLSHWYDSTPKKSRRKRDSNPGSSALEADALPLGQRGGQQQETNKQKHTHKQTEKDTNASWTSDVRTSYFYLKPYSKASSTTRYVKKTSKKNTTAMKKKTTAMKKNKKNKKSMKKSVLFCRTVQDDCLSPPSATSTRRSTPQPAAAWGRICTVWSLVWPHTHTHTHTHTHVSHSYTGQRQAGHEHWSAPYDGWPGHRHICYSHSTLWFMAWSRLTKSWPPASLHLWPLSLSLPAASYITHVRYYLVYIDQQSLPPTLSLSFSFFGRGVVFIWSLSWFALFLQALF